MSKQTPKPPKDDPYRRPTGPVPQAPLRMPQRKPQRPQRDDDEA